MLTIRRDVDLFRGNFVISRPISVPTYDTVE